MSDVEVKDGYKKTKVGVVPEDWEVRKLEDVSSKIGDGLHGTPKYDEKGKYNFINGNNLKNGKVIYSRDNKRVNEYEYIKYKKDLNDKTLLVSLNGTIGNVAVYNNEEVVLGKSAGYINLNKELCKKYIYYSFQSYHVQSYFIRNLTGTTIKNLSLATLRKTSIPIPPLKEQKKIATILSTVDEHIEEVDGMIEDLGELKKGLMQKLLMGEYSLDSSQSTMDNSQLKDEDVKLVKTKEFKKTKLGMIPKHWEVKKLGKICDILDSKRIPLNSKKREQMKGEIPYYGANGIVDYINDYIFNEDLILLAEDGGNFTDYKNRPIAFKISGKSWVNNHAHILRSKNNKSFDWIFYSLEHKNLMHIVQGGTRAKLNQKDLKKIKIPIPPLKEQQKIASILSSVDKRIETYKDQKEDLNQLKKGLMQQLLTGKTRVEVN